MISPGDKVQASYGVTAARINPAGSPRNVPAVRAVPLPGNSNQESPEPGPSRATAAAPSRTAAATTPANQQPKLLDRLREPLRSRRHNDQKSTESTTSRITDYDSRWDRSSSFLGR